MSVTRLEPDGSDARAAIPAVEVFTKWLSAAVVI